jgi:plastocyanin
MNRSRVSARCRVASIGFALAVFAGCHATGASPRRTSIEYTPESPPPLPDASTVTIDNFTFDPPTLVVAAGSTVTWVNRDDVPHTATSNDKSFDSGPLDTDDRFSRKFEAAGTFPYYCAVHPHMTGTVVVR